MYHIETGERLRSLCINKHYVFDRMPDFKFIPKVNKQINVQSREECQDLCLAETTFMCRSATFDSALSICYLTESNKDLDPNYLSAEKGFDYMENVCLHGENRCQGINHFIQEDAKQLVHDQAFMSMPIGKSTFEIIHKNVDNFGFFGPLLVFIKEVV